MVGTIAMFEVIAPSIAFSVETTGWLSPSGHKRQIAQRAHRHHRRVEHVGLRRARRSADAVHHIHRRTQRSTERLPIAILRVSITRQGAAGYSDSPPCPGGAK